MKRRWRRGSPAKLPSSSSPVSSSYCFCSPCLFQWILHTSRLSAASPSAWLLSAVVIFLTFTSCLKPRRGLPSLPPLQSPFSYFLACVCAFKVVLFPVFLFSFKTILSVAAFRGTTFNRPVVGLGLSRRFFLVLIWLPASQRAAGAEKNYSR